MVGFTTSDDIELTENGETYIDTVDKYYNAKGENITEDEYIKIKSEKRDDFE